MIKTIILKVELKVEYDKKLAPAGMAWVSQKIAMKVRSAASLIETADSVVKGVTVAIESAPNCADGIIFKS